MSIKEIQEEIDASWHEIGHTKAFVGAGRYLTAQMAISRTIDTLKKVYQSLDELQNQPRQPSGI